MNFRLWVNALTKPKVTFAREKENASLIGGIKQVIIAGFIITVSVFVFVFIKVFSMAISRNEFAGFFSLKGIDVAEAIGILVGFFVGIPIMLIVSLLFWSLLFFVIAKILGGRGSYGVQTYYLALFQAPLRILAFTFMIMVVFSTSTTIVIGMLILALGLHIYSLYPLTIALKEAHDFSIGKSIACWVVPEAITLTPEIILVLKVLTSGW